MLRKLASVLPGLWSNWLTLTGTILTTVCACVVVFSFATELSRAGGNPYWSAFVLLVAPAVFALGLLLVAAGVLWERRRRQSDEGAWHKLQEAFRTAMDDPRVRGGMVAVVLATLANIVLAGAGAQRALEYTGSVAFCGTLCHTVMEPQFAAYKRSAHRRVPCVQCHVGPGTAWATKAKMSGLRRVAGVLTGDFHRPIPAPVHDLRPARDTCEGCHARSKHYGKRLRFSVHYGDDASSSERVTALLVNVGGPDTTSGEYGGVHAHIAPDTKITYEALDTARTKIGRVTVARKGKPAQVYALADERAEPVEVREMDCTDCHNRPGHSFDATPRHAVDRGFQEGRLDRSVPYLHKVAVQLLADDTQPRQPAAKRIAEALQARYAADYPEVKLSKAQMDGHAAVLARLYRANVFPEMGVKWGSYPTQLGHGEDDEQTRGCFRCHDDEHAAEDGAVISQDCDLCHELLHEDEPREELPAALQTLLAGQPE